MPLSGCGPAADPVHAAQISPSSSTTSSAARSGSERVDIGRAAFWSRVVLLIRRDQAAAVLTLGAHDHIERRDRHRAAEGVTWLGVAGLEVGRLHPVPAPDEQIGGSATGSAVV